MSFETATHFDGILKKRRELNWSKQNGFHRNLRQETALILKIAIDSHSPKIEKKTPFCMGSKVRWKKKKQNETDRNNSEKGENEKKTKPTKQKRPSKTMIGWILYRESMAIYIVHLIEDKKHNKITLMVLDTWY